MKPDWLVQIMGALPDVDLVEEYLEDEENPKLWVHGDCMGSRIRVNPAPSVVDTVIHEMLHYLKPEWSEQSVRAQTTRILRGMNHQQVYALWREWERRKRVVRA